MENYEGTVLRSDAASDDVEDVIKVIIYRTKPPRSHATFNKCIRWIFFIGTIEQSLVLIG